MYTNTEMRTPTQYRCSQCYTNCPTQKIFQLHTTMCKFIHTSSYERTIDQFYSKMETPSQEAMAQYIFHLTHKYQELEDKLSKLQQSVISIRRKSINEYLEHLSPPDNYFIEWATLIEIPDDILETLFKTDLKSGTRKLLESLFEDDNTPIRAFSQKPNTFYIYDKSSEWRIMTNEEFTKWIEKIEHKFLKKFNEWTKENQEIYTLPQGQEKIVSYMAKVNGIKQPNRVSEIKKWLYSKISVSLKQLVV